MASETPHRSPYGSGIAQYSGAPAPVSGGLFLSQRGGETSTTSTTTAVSASSTRVGMLGGSAPGASPAARPPTAPGGTAMSRLSAELEAVRNNWRAEGSVTRSKMMDLHHAKIRAEEALHEAKAAAKAAAIKATQREDSLKAEISSLRSALDSVQRERARQEQEWLSQAGTFRRNIEALREQAGELDKEIQTVEAGRQAALARAEAAEAQNRGLEGNLQSLRQDITRLEVVLSETRSAASQEASGQRAEAEAAAAAHRDEVQRLQGQLDEQKRKYSSLHAEYTSVRTTAAQTEESLRASISDVQVRAARDATGFEERLTRAEAERDLALQNVAQLKQLLATAEGEFSAVATAVDLLSRGQSVEAFSSGGGGGGFSAPSTPHTTVVNVSTSGGMGSPGISRRLSPSI